MNIAKTVRSIHFEDFSGSEFERLVFAYHLCDGWDNLAWYGQTGSDQGRDIIGTKPFDDRPDELTVIQCVNRTTLTQAKAEKDMTAAVGAATGLPAAFKFVCRCNVSAKRRDEVTKAAHKLGIGHVTIWAGTEFEEHLRLRAEFLLRRLIEGVTFPDSADEIRDFVGQFSDVTDEQALAMFARTFDRPAFQTPFQHESNLPAFLKAIEDTIRALSTGIWQTRENVEIHRIPSLHHVRDPSVRSALQATVHELDNLRRRYKALLSTGAIRPCGCGNPSCPTFMLTDAAAREMDHTRNQVLTAFRKSYPSYTGSLR
jgi:hypothetical protein